MIFEDRTDAGRKLAAALKNYEGKPNTLVLALPRGGVVVGYEVATALHLPLDIICPRKIGAPANPELAIGAVTETGEAILSQELITALHISDTYIQQALEQEKQEALRRLHYFRKDRPPRQINGATVILIDDGLATGSTMRAAIKTARAEHAGTLILAVPVAPPDTFSALKKEVDIALALATPPAFYAVGQFYNHFDQTSDTEVLTLLTQSTKSTIL